MLSQTPSAFYALQSVDAHSRELGTELKLQAVVFGGEALEPQRLRTWLDDHPGIPRLINMYGITETTVHASFREIVAADVDSIVSPIGVPLAHLGFFVLDGWLRPVPAVWWASCTWPATEWHTVIGPAGFDGDAVCGVPVRRARAPACIAPETWRGGVLTGSCAMWGAPTNRSRSAGIASSSVRSRRRSAGLDGVDQAVVIAREDRPGDKRLVGYVTGTADPAGVRPRWPSGCRPTWCRPRWW